MSSKMTYRGVGVDYDALDRFKRKAQEAARTTAHNIERLGWRMIPESYGESAFLIESTDDLPYLTAHVEEGLGTKNLVADAMYLLTGKSYYDNIAQDTVAMIVNDIITLGALPLSVAMHLAVGDSSWFNDEKRCRDLIAGWKKACDLARCAWGGGETPTLKGIVVPGTALLSGSALGVKYKEQIGDANIQHGDAIILIESSGIHANGLTMAREIGERKDGLWRRLINLFFPHRFPLLALPDGYLTRLSDGRFYGEALLDPTHIYVPLMEECLNRHVNIHRAVNITGHGWRTLMRAEQPFAYIIDVLPRQQPIFDFIQKHGPVDDREAFGNLNMSAGFALYVPESDVNKVVYAAALQGQKAFCAGYVERSVEKKVVIKPRGLEYSGATLEVR